MCLGVVEQVVHADAGFGAVVLVVYDYILASVKNKKCSIELSAPACIRV